MSKNHNKNYQYRSQANTTNMANVVKNENEDVTARVTPEEGVNSIEETVVVEEAVQTESVHEEVSVADTQESEINETEDSTATTQEEPEEVEVVADEPEVEPEMIQEETPEEEMVTPVVVEPVEPGITTPVITQPVVATNDLKENAFYFSLGEISGEKMPVVEERLKKAGYISSSFIIDDVLVIGPFTTEVECITAKKALVGKGLKGKIIER